MNDRAQPPRFAYLIFARNEAQIIAETIAGIFMADQSACEVIVVADNCSDETALLAQRAGAKVLIRAQKGPHGKGAAMQWLLVNHYQSLANYDYLVILDADSRICKDFSQHLFLELKPKTRAAQCCLSPTGYEGSPLSTLIALSEIVEQSVFDRVRAIVGLSVRLRGTGMVFQTGLLQEVARQIDTEVEDIVLSLLLAQKKVIVQQITSATVFDPKPVDAPAASRQRGRWFRGQWAALWQHRGAVFSLLFKGINGWAVLGSLFLKPRWLKLSLLLVLSLIFLRLPIVGGILLGLAIFEISLILIGMLQNQNRWLFFKALIGLPAFILMWLKGILLSLKRLPWLRSRGVPVDLKKVDPLNHDTIETAK